MVLSSLAISSVYECVIGHMYGAMYQPKCFTSLGGAQGRSGNRGGNPLINLAVAQLAIPDLWMTFL
jgi:hypothetical protein